MVVKPLTAHAIYFCLSLQHKLHIIYFMKTPLTSQFLVNLKNESPIYLTKYMVSLYNYFIWEFDFVSNEHVFRLRKLKLFISSNLFFLLE